MNKIVIIIPSRLDAQRLPNKPLKLINNKEMILHVYDSAIRSNTGEVYVATPDQQIVDIVKNFGGNAVKTSNNHETGTDRIFEVFRETLNSEPNIIINLQGDMPNLESQAISNLVSYMSKNKCDIGTLASDFNTKDEIDNPNVEFIRPCNLCPHMKRITLPKILDCLENESNELIMDNETIERARKSVERMAEIGR